jgi:SAM-dependent methyltransferase
MTRRWRQKRAPKVPLPSSSALPSRNIPTMVQITVDDQAAEATTEVAPTAPPLGPEVLTIADFRRRFEDGELSLDVAFCVENEARTAGIEDPCSPEYAALVMETWQAITGRSDYRATDDETFELDDADYLARPWPFCSSNPAEVGRYFGAVAAIIGGLGKVPPARIVEFGAGWGHLSLDLAATGFQVSAVDLNPASVALLRRRASLLGVDLDVVLASFLEFEPDDPVDVFIFFESFHHCEAPFELLDRCTRQLAIGGQMVFAADAIYDDFHADWGVRLDGSATFMAAKHGWLELGFSRPFLEGELRKRGFEVTWEVRPELGAYGTFLTATQMS